MAAIFKYSEGRNLNRNMITTVNYVAAVMVSLFMILQKRLAINIGIVSFKAFFREFTVLGGAKFSSTAVGSFALILGLVTGVIYFVGIIAMQLSVRNYGAGLTGMFNRAGVIIPIVLSILLWNELPTAGQWLGIILAMTGIVLVNLSDEKDKRFKFHLPLLVLLLTGGLGALASKVFQVYAPMLYRSVFLLFVFGSALIISLFYTMRTAKAWNRQEIFAGIGVGICNQFAATFLLLALNALPGPVVYPLAAAGTIVVNNIMGLLLFKEQLKRKEWIAILLTIVAVLLLA